MSTKYQTLKSSICDAMHATRSTRNEMRVLKTESRTARKAGDTSTADTLMRQAVGLWEDANYDRDERRVRHLAYAYLRGRTYHQCERTCKEAPDAGWVFGIIHDHIEEELRDTLRSDIEAWIKAGDITRFDQHPRTEAAPALSMEEVA
jgi:hypothetical protein